MTMRQLATATVDVLYYQSGVKAWIKPEGGSVESKSTEGRANLFLIQEYSAGYRIVAQRVTDNQPLLDQIIYRNFFYKVTQPTFHQWKSESKQVFGLVFLNPDEAEEFSNIVQKAVLDVNSSINNNGGNIYQDPQVYGEQQQPIYSKEPDSESIGSAGQMNNYQQNQQKSSYSSLNNGQAGTLNQQNRRCSSTSNGPSSSNVYATSTLGQKNLQNGFHNEMHQVSSAPQMNGGSQQQQKVGVPPPPAPPLPSNGIPPISKQIPPPPPPPPDLKFMTAPKGPSFAEQLKLKSGNLNKVPANDVNGTNNSETPPTPQPKASIPGGHSNVMSELMSKIESRNNTKNCKADTVSTGSSSGVSSSSVGASSDTLDSVSTLTTKRMNASGDIPTKPWQKPNGIQGITSIAAAQNAIESPKALRKLTSEPTSPTVTVEYLNQFKQEVLAEVRQEISKAKQDIINAIRELGR